MQKINFLFWNLNRKNLSDEISAIAHENEVHVLVLAEANNVSESDLLTKLNQKQTVYFSNHPLSNCDKIKIFTRFDYIFISPKIESQRYSMRLLELPQVESLNIIGLHFRDKSHNSDTNQSELASDFAHEINEIEKKFGDKTIIIGDFNMNPFEVGMIKAKGFNATMSSVIAQDGSCQANGKEYKYFYNPMWSLYGDVKNQVAGSYFYSNSELVNYRWNVFDQVLIRPNLVSNFVKESLVFLHKAGKKSLLTKKGYPNKTYSDHLPLFFTLKLNEL
jgi:Endonuclease/Exonuclease/phosphatase family